MNLAILARKLGANECTRLVETTGNIFEFKGASIGLLNFRIDFGGFSSKKQIFCEIPPILVALDTTQYLLCIELSKLPKTDPYRKLLSKVRMQHILGFIQLHALLSIPNPGPHSKQIADWIEFMQELTKKSIILVGPRPTNKELLALKRETFSKIDAYQGIKTDTMAQKPSTTQSLKYAMEIVDPAGLKLNDYNYFRNFKKWTDSATVAGTNTQSKWHKIVGKITPPDLNLSVHAVAFTNQWYDQGTERVDENGVFTVGTFIDNNHPKMILRLELLKNDNEFVQRVDTTIE
jgi:hypothetical protein